MSLQQRLIRIEEKLDRLLGLLSSENFPKGEPDNVSLTDLIPLMPPGLRSRSSIYRLLADGTITGSKVRGTWTFSLKKVRADLAIYERPASLAGFLAKRRK